MLTVVVLAPTPILIIPLVPALISKSLESGPFIVVIVAVVTCAVVVIISVVITSEFNTSPVIILFTPSTNSVLSSPNTLPCMSVTNC